jgi:hypothetical protein
MKKLMLVLLALVLALPSIASAVQPSGTPVLVPDSGSDSGGGPAPKSWLFNDIFFVRAHTCRATGNITLCGPDPLISSSAGFNGVIRIWVPFPDLYTVYFFVTDSEGNVINFSSGNFNLDGNTFNSLLNTFSPVADGLYKFLGLAVGNGRGTITFSNHYQFRVGGPASGSCCP